MGRLAPLLLVAALACPGPKARGTGGAPGKPAEITLFLTAELKGTVEPCGCTSDPLGDLARTAAVVEDARAKGPTLLFDGGSMSFSQQPLAPNVLAEQRLRAELLGRVLGELGLAAAGLGPSDLADGPGHVRPARQAANVPASLGVPLDPPRIVEVGGARIGVFGVVDPAAVPGADEPEPAARVAIEALRRKGAQVILALAHMPRARARKLAAAAPGIDLVLVGQDVPERGEPDPEHVGTSWLVSPGNRGQALARIDLAVAPEAGPLTDAIGPGRATARIAVLDAEIAAAEQRLAAWSADPTADPAFLAARRQQLDERRSERDELVARPKRVPPQGSWFTLQIVPIRKNLRCDADVQTAKTRLDRTVGELNQRLAAGETTPAPAAGAAHTVGVEECGYCHRAAVNFWRGTAHARAWNTLAQIGKEWSRECVGCHVTGWLQPGGASFAKTEGLRDVQCEVCHGPASRHVDANGKERPSSLRRDPEPELCRRACHTPEHSDTFQLEAYLRDVLGPGHGEKRRKALGDGPTGHELRQTALDRAGRALGAGCTK